MTSYVVVENWKPEKFREEIELMLERGWKLQGGVSTRTQLSGTAIYAQALIYEQPDAPTQEGK